jgi:hypothetical protein
MKEVLLSLCIPTNGISELVFPVLDSIFSQENTDISEYEVVVMDNGNNNSFKEKMHDLEKIHSNLVYKETELKGFLNEPESYRAANGAFIKFINHRTKLLPGSLSYFIAFVRNNINSKPVVYFGNKLIENIEGVQRFSCFDLFVKNLSYWSSWSTGMGIWKEDFLRIKEGTVYNELYPHTTILFNERGKNEYIIDNTKLLDEINVGHANKGKYDLFRAFSIEYLSIINDLYRDNSITLDTLLKVKADTLHFVANLYYSFVIRKAPCSYDITNIRALEVFYSKREVIMYLCKWAIMFPVRRIKRIISSQHSKKH